MMAPSKSRQGRPRSWHCAMVTGAAALALTAAACTSGAPSSSGNTPVKGGTAVFALAPSTAANYIFPYISANNQSIANMQDLQFLLYRPLYWFGQGTEPNLNNSLSLAYPPAFSGKTVTIRLKHYMWSNGTQVTAQNVMFWLNMELAVPADYGLYTGFPANVRDIKVVSPTELTMTMDQAYSPTWFLYNELSQVTPMPAAWDRTASGPSSCSTIVSDCAKVYAYLNDQAKDFSTYVTSPLWSVVDGPWRLSAFSSDGHVTFVPNKSYSGPVKPHLAQFEEVPFITAASEYNVLQSASPSTKIDVGYVPQEDVPPKPANAEVGGNPLAAKGYTLSPWPLWGISYYTMNLQSTTGNGPIMRQLYFRQAMAYLMNQKAIIEGPLRGYGTVTVGPVGNTPPSEFLSPEGKQGDPFPYNPAKANGLLTSHGWKIVPNGVSTCADPSLCGPGIKKGQGLNFSFIYATGTAWVAAEMQQLQSNAAALGIKLILQPKVPTQVGQVAGGNCVAAKLPCNWDMANYGGAWTFFPDYLPTGEDLFICGAIPDSSGFCDKQDNALIDKTLTSSNLTYMYQWQNYLAPLLPQMWQPLADYQLTEVANNLRGAAPQLPTIDILPENWYFVK
jgi:peptide/nickel transport system substrate-binding protein